MPDILKLAEITGRNIGLALEPLRVQMAALQKDIDRLVADNERLREELKLAADVDAIAKRAAEFVPAGKDGTDGLPGRDGVDGKNGENGLDGEDGRDADPVSADAVADAVAARFERRFADLTLSWERQARDTFERAVDKMPVPRDGNDGKDALPVEALDITHDGERGLTIKLGEKTHTITIPSIIYRGVWSDGEYAEGDAATYGGTLWIAKCATTQAPGTGKDWQMAVKKGRDGKDLRDNASAARVESGLQL